MRYIDVRVFIAAAWLVAAVGCGSTEVVVIPPPPEPEMPRLPGVDSVFVALAEGYARRGGLVSELDRQEARRVVSGGRRLLEIADSLMQGLAPDVDSSEIGEDAIAESIRRFNEGARHLQGDQAPGLQQLDAAAEQFELALDANPFDGDAHYWLSRVHELRYEALADSSAGMERVQILESLTRLHPDRHDYAGLLAAAYEALDAQQNWSKAGAWWHRASRLVQDESALSLDTSVVLDTSSTFIYLANSSRAYIEADEADLALASLAEATPYATSEDRRAYLAAEQKWITWDAVLSTRKRFDILLQLSRDDPSGAVSGLEDLLNQVTRPLARMEVKYQLALAMYNAGRTALGITYLQEVWDELATSENELRTRVQEDYGVMAYSLALEKRASGELRDALAYLLQSEATGFSKAPLAALTRSLLLRNDPQASLTAALRAEEGWEALDPQDQRTLLEHLVTLYRRMDKRDQAAEYARRYRELTN